MEYVRICSGSGVVKYNSIGTDKDADTATAAMLIKHLIEVNRFLCLNTNIDSKLDKLRLLLTM